jgi:hypothetical protein
VGEEAKEFESTWISLRERNFHFRARVKKWDGRTQWVSSACAPRAKVIRYVPWGSRKAGVPGGFGGGGCLGVITSDGGCAGVIWSELLNRSCKFLRPFLNPFSMAKRNEEVAPI